MNRHSNLALAFLLLFAVAAMWGCTAKSSTTGKDAKSEAEKNEQAVPVETAALTRGAIEVSARRSTTLEAEAEVKVLSRAANRVVELLVEEGDRVEADALLVRLEDDIQRTQLARAESRLDKARIEFERQKSLHDQRLVSDQAFKEVEFEFNQARLAVDDARRELVYTEVRAPISGKITRRLVRLGDHVTNNQHLFDIVDFTSIVAVVHLPEHTLRQLALEQTARVEAPAIGGATFLARVKRISPIIEAKTGTVKVTLGFENIDLLRPGLYVDVEIILAQEPDALLIPRRALVYDADQLYVFKLEEDRRARRMLVEPRLMDRWNVTPVDSFSDGDQIVVAGQTGLKDGAKVRLPSDPKPPDESKNEKGSRR